MEEGGRGGARPKAGRRRTNGWSEKKIDLFCFDLMVLVDNKQDSLFLFFSSYRTVNVVPFYLAVFPYFVVVIIHEKS